MTDVQPTMDLLGAIVDRHAEKVRRIFPTIDSAQCRCPECGGDTDVRLYETTLEYEPVVIVHVVPFTLTCRSCGAVTRCS